MKITDVIGLGKVLPINKLIDIISSVTNRLSKSYFDKKDIDTKAYEIKKIAEAKAEEVRIISIAIKENFLLTGGIEYKQNNIDIISPRELPVETNKSSILINPSLQERTNERTAFQETKKQLNIESVTAYAAEELKNEAPVTDEPVDVDWTTRFFKIVEDISNDEMQSLWGRILAGEIKQPKSFSLRTLELVKNLSKDEAEVFARFAQIRITCRNDSFIYNQDNGVFLKSEFGITFYDILLLTELGLIASETNVNYSFFGTDSILIYGNKGIFLYPEKEAPKQLIKVIAFTKTGSELSMLIQPKININYIEKICLGLRHPNVKIEYGDLSQNRDGQLTLLNKTQYI